MNYYVIFLKIKKSEITFDMNIYSQFFSTLIHIIRNSLDHGIEEKELNTLLQYMDDSGRNFLNNEVIELQGPNTFGAASTLTGKAQQKVGNFLDYSTMFFREGERVSRLTGVITAFLEHRARRPNIDPLSRW